MAEYNEKISDRSGKGAVFLAVCRGKASEGIDFSDAKGRAVVITGIPYPALLDSRVVLKRQILNENQKASSRNTTKDGSPGDVWYRTQASRAINQAIGRVIRHRHDYGAIILLDERFKSQSNISQLPAWMRPHLRIMSNFGETQRELTKFFKSAGENHCKSTASNEPMPILDRSNSVSSTDNEVNLSDILQRKQTTKPNVASTVPLEMYRIRNDTASNRSASPGGLLESLDSTPQVLRNSNDKKEIIVFESQGEPPQECIREAVDQVQRSKTDSESLAQNLKRSYQQLAESSENLRNMEQPKLPRMSSSVNDLNSIQQGQSGSSEKQQRIHQHTQQVHHDHRRQLPQSFRNMQPPQAPPLSETIRRSRNDIFFGVKRAVVNHATAEQPHEAQPCHESNQHEMHLNLMKTDNEKKIDAEVANSSMTGSTTAGEFMAEIRKCSTSDREELRRLFFGLKRLLDATMMEEEKITILEQTIRSFRSLLVRINRLQLMDPFSALLPADYAHRFSKLLVGEE